MSDLDDALRLTRQEVVEMLQSRGCDVTARDLIYWQTKGVIPYPARENRNGKSIAVYPFSIVDDIADLRRMQAEGRKLSEIRGALRHRHGAVHPLRPEDV